MPEAIEARRQKLWMFKGPTYPGWYPNIISKKCNHHGPHYTIFTFLNARSGFKNPKGHLKPGKSCLEEFLLSLKIKGVIFCIHHARGIKGLLFSDTDSKLIYLLNLQLSPWIRPGSSSIQNKKGRDNQKIARPFLLRGAHYSLYFFGS